MLPRKIEIGNIDPMLASRWAASLTLGFSRKFNQRTFSFNTERYPTTDEVICVIYTYRTHHRLISWCHYTPEMCSTAMPCSIHRLIKWRTRTKQLAVMENNFILVLCTYALRRFSIQFFLMARRHHHAMQTPADLSNKKKIKICAAE